MFSYFSLKVLIPPCAVAKCAVAAGRPAFMGRLSPALYQLVVAARHAEKYWRRQNIGACQDFNNFRQTIAVNISDHRLPTKNWCKEKVITITVQYLSTYS